MACDGCGTPSRPVLAMAVAVQPGSGRLCWTCRRGWTPEAEERFITAAAAAFPGSYEVDSNGQPLPGPEPLPPKQPAFEKHRP